MKILIILTLLISLNLNIRILIILNYIYLNIFTSPLKQLIYLIVYIIFITINILISKQNISLSLFILIIIFIRGILILFSYFIRLVNNLSIKSNHKKLIFLNIVILILSIIQTIQLKIILKNLFLNYKKNNKNNIIKKLYLKPNIYILLIFIIFLILLLLLIVKICNIKHKNLRIKK
jgi:glucan phosphoethanolaminetransferase (alkaline phosphatase superfamily)